VDPSPFEIAGEALRGMLPAELGTVRHRAHRYGIKVWFDQSTPAREHYEAQVIGAAHVADASVLAIEVGFHAENTDAGDNEHALAELVAAERRWRKALGKEPVAGPFLGRKGWRRLSETWPDPDLSDPDLPLELASRLADYIEALEPIRR
jgi:hypothetical protein